MYGKGFWIAAYSALALVVLGVVMLGWPGGVILNASLPVLGWWFAENPVDHMHPDSLWPTAFYLTLFWPLGLVWGYLVAWRFPPLPAYVLRIAVFLLVLVGWVLALSTLFYMLARIP